MRFMLKTIASGIINVILIQDIFSEEDSCCFLNQSSIYLFFLGILLKNKTKIHI